MHEHCDVKKPCRNPEAKCSKISAKCTSVLSGFLLSFYSLPISQHHLYLVKKCVIILVGTQHSRPSLNLSFRAWEEGWWYWNLWLFALFLGHSCEDLGIKVLTQLLDQLPFFKGSCGMHSTSRYFHTSVRKMASFLVRSKLVYYISVFRQQEICFNNLLIPSFWGRVCHHMAPIESRYFYYMRQKTHSWGLQIMWTQEKKKTC